MARFLVWIGLPAKREQRIFCNGWIWKRHRIAGCQPILPVCGSVFLWPELWYTVPGYCSWTNQPPDLILKVHKMSILCSRNLPQAEQLFSYALINCAMRRKSVLHTGSWIRAVYSRQEISGSFAPWFPIKWKYGWKQAVYQRIWNIRKPEKTVMILM